MADRPLPSNVELIGIEDEVQRSFLDYAMSVIVSRALPDARDGLKPVHRRILYAMWEAGIRPGTAYKKSARVVGDVMGKYHPHGDAAIYDALVRLGQNFASRYPSVDPQGNFGSVDDPPAHMRYCVTGDTLVATPGGTRRIDRLAPVAPDSEVDIDLKVVDRRGDPVRATKLFHSGLHPTLRMRTREGIELTGTANHPVLCLVEVAGVPMLLWKLLGELEPGDHVAVSRGHARPSGPGSGDPELAFLAGALVAEGFVGTNRAGFNNVDAEYFEAVLAAYDRIVGGPRYVYRRTLPSGKTIHELDVQDLRNLRSSPLEELLGAKSRQKAIPSFVWEGGTEIKRAFLQALFEGDGCVSRLRPSIVQVSYSTRSPRLAKEVQLLLLEFGVVVRQALYGSGEIELYLTSPREVREFAHRVGFWGAKQRKLERLLEEEAPLAGRGLSSDRIPYVSDYIRSEAPRGGREWLAKRNIDRIERWEAYGDLIMERLSDEMRRVVEPLVEAGYYYATVESVEDAGILPVYSIRVDSDDHAFIANGLVNHNTECRLESLAMQLLEGIDEETVDFRENYDGSEEEPEVLPARFPNLLANGGTGIAVGMATNIPPHNLGELIDAVVHVLDHPDADPEELMQFVKGPDFPTGGYVMGTAGIRDAYLTGRGSIKMRAVADVEELPKGRTAIIVREIPYQVSRDRIMEKIAKLVREKEVQGIADLRDESDREGTRLVIELKQSAEPQVILNQLYKSTQLQESFAANMVALVDGVPRTLNLAEALGYYADHQMEVVERRTRYRLRKARDRAHVVEGLLVALDNIDEVVAIIRGSEDTETARAALIERFELSEIQANHILDMPLRRLTALETTKLREEHEELMRTIADLEEILADPARRRRIISEELGGIKERFADPRRTRIIPDEGELSLEDLIADDELVISVSANGYVKSVLASAYRRQTRGGRGVKAAELREDDAITHLVHTTAHAYLLFFTNTGKVCRVKAHEIPRKDRTAKGVLAQSVLPLTADERIEAVVDTRDYETARYLVTVTKQGLVKKTRFSEYDSRSSTLIAINLQEGDEVVAVRTTNGENDLLLFTLQGMGIRFSEKDIRPTGRSTQGVRGIRLRRGDEVVAAASDIEGEEVLLITSRGYGKRVKMDEFPDQKRGGLGVKAFRATDGRGHLVSARAVSPGAEIFVVSSTGIVIRTAVDSVSRQKREASGVKVMNLPQGSTVSAFALVPAEEQITE